MLIIIGKKAFIFLVAIFLIMVLFTVGTLIHSGSIRHSSTVYNRSIEKPVERGVIDSKYIAFACNLDSRYNITRTRERVENIRFPYRYVKIT